MSATLGIVVICPACEHSISSAELLVGENVDDHGTAKEQSVDSSGSAERPCPHCGYRFVWARQTTVRRESHELPWRGMIERLPLPRAVTDHAARRVTSRTPLPPILAPLRAASGRLSVAAPPAVPPVHSIAPARARPPEPREEFTLQPPASHETTSVEPPTVPSVSPTDTSAELDPTIAPDATVDSALPEPRPKRARKWPWLVAAVALLGSLGVLLAVLWPPAPDAPASGNPNVDEQDHGTELLANSGIVETEPLVGWPAEFAARPADLWSRVGPFLVGIEYGPSETRQRASGVLVDSRGWVLIPDMPNDALSDAVVWVAPSEWTAVASQRLPIQAVVARWPKYSLAVVQVDPHPFGSFADLKFDSSTDASERWIAAGWMESRRWLTPVASAPLTDVTTPGIEVLPLSTDTGLSRSAVGSLVVGDDGRNLGVLAAAAADETGQPQAVVVFQHELTTWLADTRSVARPEPIVSTVATDPDEAMTTGDVNPESPRNPVVAPAGDVPAISLESLDRIESLNEQLLAAGGEIVTDETYLWAAELAERVFRAEQVQGAANVEVDLQRLLMFGVDPIRETWQRIAWPEGLAITETNELAAKHYDHQSGFWGYGEVIEPAGMAPRIAEGDTVLMRLIGTDHCIAIPISQSFDELAVGTRWLVWGTVEPRTRISETLTSSANEAWVVRSQVLIEEPEVLIPARD
ncbi:MAG: hypothetical protein KDA83_02130 [Planctomycetales bacterium]|nr:hypothetical protein [Planctomycetales bacterium]